MKNHMAHQKINNLTVTDTKNSEEKERAKNSQA
jgi:hypothetical protein